MGGPDRLFATRWVHAYEHDTAAGAAFVPDSPAIPLSRRPREQVVFHEDGTAEYFTGTPDDRLAGTPARWHEAGGAVGPTAGAGLVLVLIERHEQRLVIRVERHGEA